MCIKMETILIKIVQSLYGKIFIRILIRWIGHIMIALFK